MHYKPVKTALVFAVFGVLLYEDRKGDKMEKGLNEQEFGRLERTLIRYEVKSNPARFAGLLREKRQEMVQNYAEHAQVAQRLSQIVKVVTDSLGVPVTERFWYQSFARQVEKLWRRRHRLDLRGS